MEKSGFTYYGHSPSECRSLCLKTRTVSFLPGQRGSSGSRIGATQRREDQEVDYPGRVQLAP